MTKQELTEQINNLELTFQREQKQLKARFNTSALQKMREKEQQVDDNYNMGLIDTHEMLIQHIENFEACRKVIYKFEEII